MAITRIQDIVDPQVLADQVSAKFPDQLVIGNSQLVEVDTEFPLGSPGTTFTIPFWKRVAAFGDMTEGTALTTNSITALKENATVVRGGAAYEVYDTAQLVSKSDPVGEIAGQIARRAAEYIDSKLVAQAEHTPNTYDQSVVSTGIWDQNTAITAMTNTLGDNYARMLSGGALIVHSKVLGDLLKTGAIQNQYQSGLNVIQSGQLPHLNGLPVYTSDLVTVSTVSGTTYYNSYIIGKGSLALFYQRQVEIEFDRDVLLKADVISADVHFAPHLYGWDDNSSAVVAEQNKSIHAVLIKSK